MVSGAAGGVGRSAGFAAKDRGAVVRVRRWAEEENPVVQLMLPMVEIVTLAQQGAGELIREAGLQLILLAMAQEVEALTGTRYGRSPDRQAQRGSREDGFVVVDGQKVPLERPRWRSKNGGEVRLGTHELFQQTRHLDDQVWWKMLRSDHAELPAGDAQFCASIGDLPGYAQRSLERQRPAQRLAFDTP
jgi:hypothetical protein